MHFPISAPIAELLILIVAFILNSETYFRKCRKPNPGLARYN